MANKRFILTDETVNEYGFRFLMSGADCTDFDDNPLMLKNHEDEVDDVIGRWENRSIVDGVMSADAVFDMEDPEAAKIGGKVNRGFIKCCSIGAIPLETSSDPTMMLPGQLLPTVTRWKLKEVSIVSKGANKNAKVHLFDECGKKIDMKAADVLLKLKSGNVEPKIENMKINELLKLKADATPDEQASAIQLIISAKDKAENELQVLKDKEEVREKAVKEALAAEALKLTDAAVADGRINADAKPSFLKMFEADHETAKTALSNIPVRKPITDQLGGGSNDAEYNEMVKLSFSELDKQGKLGTLRAKYPSLYKEKFEAWKAEKK